MSKEWVPFELDDDEVVMDPQEPGITPEFSDDDIKSVISSEPDYSDEDLPFGDPNEDIDTSKDIDDPVVKSAVSTDQVVYPEYKSGSNLAETMNNLRGYKSPEMLPHSDIPSEKQTISAAISDTENSVTSANTDYKSLFDSATNKLTEQSEKIANLQAALAEKDAVIEKQAEELTKLREKSDQNSISESEISKSREEIDNLRSELAGKNTSLEQKNMALIDANNVVERQKQTISDQESVISGLNKKIEDLSAANTVLEGKLSDIQNSKTVEDTEKVETLQKEIGRLTAEVRDREADLSREKEESRKLNENYARIMDSFEQYKKNVASGQITSGKKPESIAKEEINAIIADLRSVTEDLKQLSPGVGNIPTQPTGKIYSQQEFDEEARKTFRYLEDTLVNAMMETNSHTAQQFVDIVHDIFNILCEVTE